MSKTLTIKELHTIFLGMMEEFHNFCVEHNLTYYMVGGTLLGAVREKGFIPWDDDVDFAMPRPDYERFIKLYNGSMTLHCHKRNPGFSFPYTKLFKTDCPSVLINDPLFGIKSNKVFVQFDLYPLDGAGCTAKQATALINSVNRWKRLWYINFSRDRSPSLIKNLTLKLFRCIPNCWFVRIIDHKMKHFSYAASDYITRWRGSLFFDKSWFDQPVFIPFEHLLLPAPAKFDQYLTTVYGDYMTPCNSDTGMRHAITDSFNHQFTSHVEQHQK